MRRKTAPYCEVHGRVVRRHLLDQRTGRIMQNRVEAHEIFHRIDCPDTIGISRRRAVGQPGVSGHPVAVNRMRIDHGKDEARHLRSVPVYSARNARLIAGYLEEVLGQFRPYGEGNTARAALLPFIDTSNSAERPRQLEDEP